MRKFVLLSLLAFLFCSAQAFAQNMQVTGKVTSEDGQPMAGVAVSVVGTTTGVATSTDGTYRLSAPRNGELEFFFIGMKEIIEPIGGRSVINVTMTADATQVDEIVVTGYSVIRKVAFTGAAGSVDSDKINMTTDANFMKGVQGSVSGLQMYNISGQPGAFASVRIRGNGSLSSATGKEPLYVIDGVPMFSDASSFLNPVGNGASFTSPMAGINSDDIVSVNVLKDATATAIYGSRAANGVIVITTKRGKEGALKVNFSAKKGFATHAHLDSKYRMVNTSKYFDIWAEGIANASNMSYDDAMVTAKSYATIVRGYDPNKNVDTDWLKAILRTGQIDDYTVSVSGGNHGTTFYASGGYMRNEGIVIGTGTDRYTFRTNVESKGRLLTFGVNASASITQNDNSATESQWVNPLVAAYDLTPVQSIYNDDGTFNIYTQDPGNPRYHFYNPVALAEKKYGNKNKQRIIQSQINPYVMADFGGGFIAKSSLGIDIFNLMEDKFSGKYDAQGIQNDGSGQKYNSTQLNLVNTNTLTWTRDFDRHHVNVMVGEEAQRMRDEYLYGWASGFPFEGQSELIMASTPRRTSSSKGESILMSFMFNAEYDFDNRYYLSASVRTDGSSRFGKDNRWGTFYSVGGKYRISEEEFFQPVKRIINNLAIRSSYGTVGNQEIGWYTARGFYVGGYNYNTRPGAMLTAYPNKDLSWESRSKFNIGLDIRLVDRISIEFDYYYDVTKDMLFQQPQSLTTGIATLYKNMGKIRNEGFELMVNANILRSRKSDFRWDFNFNISKNNNKIKALEDDKPIVSGITIQQKGKSLNTFYMREWAGVDYNTGAPLWYKGTEGKETTSNYNEAGLRIVGKADPKFYGGFGTSLAYKGFDLALNFTYSYGGKVYNSGFGFDLHNGDNVMGPVSNYVYKNAWTERNKNAKVPRFVFGDTSQAASTSSRFLMSGSYMRLQSATLGYTLPKALLRKARIDNMRVFVSGDNLFNVRSKNFIGFDPEAGTTGIQSWVYPMATNIMFGVTFGF